MARRLSGEVSRARYTASGSPAPTGASTVIAAVSLASSRSLMASWGRVAASSIGRPSIAGCLDAGRAPVDANAQGPVPVEHVQPGGVDAAGDFSGGGVDGVHAPGWDELGSAAPRHRA